MSGAADTPVVLFDGDCNLCNHAVTFIIDRDPAAIFRFASLQSDVAAQLLAPDEAGSDTIILLQSGRTYTHSDAALRIASRLRRPWSWLAVLLLIPRPLRDAAYRFVARNRYRWFGRQDSCRLPTPELLNRFLC